MNYDFERNLDAKESRRFKAQDRFLTRMEKREREAEGMIGTLIRDGKTIHYVWPAGGRYREGEPWSLVSFLVRNRYV